MTSITTFHPSNDEDVTIEYTEHQLVNVVYSDGSDVDLSGNLTAYFQAEINIFEAA